MSKRNIWQRLGPGIMLAATSIGASHLVHSPRAGALYGFSLLWLVVAAHLFKYPAFEFGPRYAAATGGSLLAGYARVPGPRMWALYLFLASTILQGVGVLAGVVNISGCVLATWFGNPTAELVLSCNSTEISSLVVLASVIALLYLGGFSLLDHLNKVFMAILAVATMMAFIPVVPGPSELTNLFVPTFPEGSIILVAAILGWMPTGIDVSVWHSFWTLEKLSSLGERIQDTNPIDRLRRLKIAITDMRVGYILSLVTGIAFVVLGAVHLQGRGGDLRGIQFAEAISGAYTAMWGRWMYHVFMLTAFFAMFSTSYTVIDGFSRSFSEALSVLSPIQSSGLHKRRNYFAFVTVSGLLSAATIIWVGNPVTLVLAVSLVSLALAPILYLLNLYCVSKHITDPALKPSKITVVLGCGGIILMLVAFIVTVYIKVFQ